MQATDKDSCILMFKKVILMYFGLTCFAILTISNLTEITASHKTASLQFHLFSIKKFTSQEDCISLDVLPCDLKHYST